MWKQYSTKNRSHGVQDSLLTSWLGAEESPDWRQTGKPSVHSSGAIHPTVDQSLFDLETELSSKTNSHVVPTTAAATPTTQIRSTSLPQPESFKGFLRMVKVALDGLRETRLSKRKQALSNLQHLLIRNHQHVDECSDVLEIDIQDKLPGVYKMCAKPLLSRFADSCEWCRERAVRLVLHFINQAAWPDVVSLLPYVVPVVMYRLVDDNKQTPDNEDVEDTEVPVKTRNSERIVNGIRRVKRQKGWRTKLLFAFYMLLLSCAHTKRGHRSYRTI